MKLVKQALKDFRRWQQGWGDTADGPREILERVQKLSDADLVDKSEEFMFVVAFGRYSGKHSPAGVTQRLMDREVHKRFGCDTVSVLNFVRDL